MVHQFGTPSTPKNTDLPIAQHGKRKRATLTIALDVEDDADIIECVNRIKKEFRQERLKNAIRDGMPQLTAVEYDQSRLMEMAQELLDKVTWLVNYFMPFHSYLEEKFANIGFRPFGSAAPTPEPKPGKKLTKEQIETRAKNGQEAEW